MRTAPSLLLSFVAAVTVGACSGGTAVIGPPSELEPHAERALARETGRAEHFRAERVVSGLNRPTWVGAAPGDDRALWVAEQPGRVVRLAGLTRRTVLDLRGRITVGGEQGLLGLAFHPDFVRNRLLYAHWSGPGGETRVAEFEVDSRARHHRTLLTLDQPEENHNGGQLAFGPDGRLYLGLGDGGGAFDPRRTAQDTDRLLGKIVAADVADEDPRWETVVLGLRNPWRFSFDFALGELWIGDVGQDSTEEVNRVLLELDEPPKNLGWSVYEGMDRIPGSQRARGPGQLVFPVAGYEHGAAGHCSITGGVIYGGAALPALSRRYVYGDFCTGALWTLRPLPAGGAADVRRERAVIPQLTHIGTDAGGELVFAAASGSIYRAAPAGSAS